MYIYWRYEIIVSINFFVFSIVTANIQYLFSNDFLNKMHLFVMYIQHLNLIYLKLKKVKDLLMKTFAEKTFLSREILFCESFIFFWLQQASAEIHLTAFKFQMLFYSDFIAWLLLLVFEPFDVSYQDMTTPRQNYDVLRLLGKYKNKKTWK